jgi:adenylate kinase family enzyme
MKKILVIGSGGSGKSTFSKYLGEKLGLPVVHLDQLFWRPNWTRTPEDEWVEVVRRETARDEWIMDGNFGGTREMRMEACDTIIYLDMPRWLCMYRILKRSFIYRRRARPDMAEGCRERLDLEFILWVWNYPHRSGKRVEAELERFRQKKVVKLRSKHEVDQFLRLL